MLALRTGALGREPCRSNDLATCPSVGMDNCVLVTLSGDCPWCELRRVSEWRRDANKRLRATLARPVCRQGQDSSRGEIFQASLGQPSARS